MFLFVKLHALLAYIYFFVRFTPNKFYKYIPTYNIMIDSYSLHCVKKCSLYVVLTGYFVK